MKRVIFDAILFISVFIFPWWVSLFFVIIGLFIFNNFYEFIVASVIIYSLYGIPSDRIISSPIFFVSIIIIFYFAVHFIKSRMILYKK